jgi:hypothetical protein
MKKNGMKDERHVFRPVKKLLFMARITAFMLLVGLLQVSAGSFSQTVKLNLKMENVTILQVFEQIEKQTQYRFFYDSDLNDLSRRTSVESLDKPLTDVLDELFANTNISYQIKDRIILIKQNGESPAVSNQQPHAVKGKVTDSAGNPLPGVTVVLKGTTTGTITDGSGEYQLTDVPDDGVLMYTFVGMKMQEVKVAGKSTITIKM